MKVAVVTSSPPLSEGGHLVIARSVVDALRDAGHDAGLVLTPQNRFGRQASAYLATWLTDVGVAHDGTRIDHVISFRYPSYAVRHPRHVVWLNHRMREYYDLWDRFQATLSWKARIKERLRRSAIHRVDTYLLTRRVTRVFAQSATIQGRLRRFGNIRADVLYPPAPPRPYRCDGYGAELFAVSRFTPLKRIDLLVRALAEPAAAGVRCTIAGDGEEAPRIRQLVRDHALETRVTLLGAVDAATLVARLASCRAVVFPAFEEDFGLVTVEAFASSKAVITCRDSGGPAELVRDGESGLVCEPTPASLAGALASLADDRGLAERLGAGAAAIATELTWPKTVERLLLRDAR
ncbi:MAG TPA: glycosyltransferase family 4 protein [Vicinamibacterales bacterium]|nr:glycosyltransferase family 4 protein [Vicinamibacterales bacterium]